MRTRCSGPLDIERTEEEVLRMKEPKRRQRSRTAVLAVLMAAIMCVTCLVPSLALAAKPTTSKKVCAQIAKPTFAGTVISWTGVTGAGSYRVRISAMGTTADVIVTRSPYDAAAAMDWPATYTATVTAIGTKGYKDGPESVPSDSVTRFGQAKKPTIDPATGEATWPAVDGCANYGIELQPGSLAFTSSAPSYSLGTTLRGLGSGSYTITVRALGNGVSTLDGEPSVASDPVNVSRLATPQAIFNGTEVRWQAISGAATYEVALTRDGSRVVTASTTETYCALSPSMSEAGTYYATVQAFAGGTGLALDSDISTPAGPMTRLPQADKPTLAANGDVSWSGGGQCLVILWQGGTAINNRTTTVSPYNIMDLIEGNGSGTYYVTVELTSSSDRVLPGARSVPSNPQTFTFAAALPTPAAPVWNGTTATWSPVSGASGYHVALYRDGAALSEADTTDTQYDFTSALAGAGLYTATVKALGDGVATLDSVESGPSSPLARFSGGAGTAVDPFLISSVADLDRVRHARSAHFRLAADLDLTGSGFEPIVGEFTGRLDGAGHTIANFTHSEPTFEGSNGLFLQLGTDGVISNLKLTQVNLDGYCHAAGALVADNYGTIEGCTVTGRISGKDAGMITATNAGIIRDCVGGAATGGGTDTDLVNADSYGGGIAAINNGLIDGCQSRIHLIAKRAGGVAGCSSGTISTSVGYMPVSGSVYTAGIVAELTGGTVQNCFAMMTLLGGGDAQGRIWAVSSGGTGTDNYALSTMVNQSGGVFDQKAPTARDGADIAAEACRKVFNAFSVTGEATPSVVDWLARTIVVTLPAGQDRTALPVTFMATPGSTTTIAGVPQTTGSPVNLTAPVTYRITAADGTFCDWTVTAENAVAALAKVPQPTWSDSTLNWNDVQDEVGYRVALYWEDGATPVATRDLAADVNTVDLTSEITAKGSGAYRATVTALADGTAHLNGPASDLSGRLVRFSGGSGTRTDPYQVALPIDLNNIRYSLTSHFLQTADVDLSAYQAGAGWQPIGSSLTPFSGTFNGGGKAITGLRINRPNEDYVGLFGYAWPIGVAADCFSNVRLVNVTVVGHQKVAGLVGMMSAAISNSSVSGSVTGALETGMVAGYAQISKLDHCVAEGTVSGPDRGGGLVGYAIRVQFTHCHTTVDVTGIGCLGGIAGIIDVSTLDGCTAHGMVSGNNNAMGGLVGRSISSYDDATYHYGINQIRDCFALNPSIGFTGIGLAQIGRIIGAVDGPTGFANSCGYSGMALPARQTPAAGADGTDCCLEVEHKVFTGFGFYGIAPNSVTIDAVSRTITVRVSPLVDMTNLIATFALTPGASVTANGVPQVSGVTANNFSNPIIYRVVGWDSTLTDWTVTVIAATAQ